MAKAKTQGNERYQDLISAEHVSGKGWKIIEYDSRMGARISYVFSNRGMFREDVIPREMLMR